MFKTILITGGAGFVGSNLAIYLQNSCRFSKILVLDNLKRRGSELNLNRLAANGIDFVHGDVRNFADIKSVGNFDLLIECSAEPSALAGYYESPEYLLHTNVLGTINCLEIIRQTNASIIFLSTSRVYPIQNLCELELIEKETRFSLALKNCYPGVTALGVNEDFPLYNPRTLYGTSKLASELLLLEYFSTYEVTGVINRCGVIAGPWQMGKVDQGFISLWIASHIFNKKLKYIGFNGSGKQVRDVLHINDLCELIQIQIEELEKFNGKTFNIGGGLKNSISLLELTALVQEATGKSMNIAKSVESRPGDIPWYITDYSKINQLSVWYPRLNLENIIEDTVSWIQGRKEQLKNIF